MKYLKRGFTLILILLVLFSIIGCSIKSNHVDGISPKEMARSIFPKSETSGSIDKFVEIYQDIIIKKKETLNLREKSEDFLLYNKENPSTKGVLLIHGLGASPNEVLPLGEYLYEKGFTVIGVRLSGHGEGLDALEDSTWEDWYNDVEFGLEVLKYLTEETHVVGVSTGGSLALMLAENTEFHELVVVAPAVVMKDWKVNYMWLFKHFKKYSARTLTEEEKITYDEAVPTQSVHELKKLINAEKKTLDKITEPVLIIQATQDPRVKNESAEYVYEHISTKNESKRIKWIESDKHVILAGDTQEEVFSNILGFLS
ncbi:alpha/beta fold hydrolase [Candidatus Woesearchaeota archaeon]|jgi:carboxylesterase|nr:alpha/beta fold hydrolase [Candidatus Woesearchaeota archaeon]MBT5272086.1 alpha/beta fold hydrolase [Candidatus Woesearchaeota archaeon]MBT6041836.1 alpha/beta fold hydrolase [Candidatus Woesearchaeota archaeon]MBT6336789.1 alpha/beta fold hydrolase [Candidatus Woesearchaeota archaeon]MBT7927676.1 alpha/beta fold hydrolase [Candidatus Woesearchaeota archaeon]